ncbi:zinc finger BED domain-containing protein 4-like [Brevipalpus obovatus]|uniref:zinc finger BED domain-containing protein 4-like n=1 Tax=Brevipalpus obovatus TaxID=246614 RepID=UPI003D9E9A4A
MTIGESFDFINSFRDSGNRSENYSNAIATWISKDVVAANTIAGEGFKDIFQIISPQYLVPHPDTIKRRIDSNFFKVENYIISKLAQFDDIALTADNWTHQFNNNQYPGVTAHGLNGQFIESSCIACRKFDETHTAINVCSLFESIIESWKIERGKIVACFTDNARNIANAVDLFLGRGRYVSRFAHSLNLVVKKALQGSEEITSMIQAVKDIVTYFHHSPKATNLLNSFQESHLKL